MQKTLVSKTKVVKKITKAVKKAVSKPKPTKVDGKNAKNVVKNSAKSSKTDLPFKAKTLSQKQIEQYAKKATKGPEESNLVVLGRYKAGSPDSYDTVAKDLYAQYFNLDNFDELVAEYGKEEMWKINKKFLDNQMQANRMFVFTQNPNKVRQKTYLSKAAKYLSANGYKFKKSGGYWYAYRK